MDLGCTIWVLAMNPALNRRPRAAHPSFDIWNLASDIVLHMRSCGAISIAHRYLRSPFWARRLPLTNGLWP